MALPHLILNALRCGRAERALFTPLNLVLEAGQAARVHGENGVGKTTLLRTVAGLQRAVDGEVVWHGPDADSADPLPLRAQLCFVGHENALNAALSPCENLDVLMRLAGRRVDQTTIRAALRNIGLAKVSDRPCARLSAGQKRRVSLARLWLTRAPLWLLDEPASALDVDSRAALCERIAAHVSQGGLVLFTTHEALTLPQVSVDTIRLQPC